MKRRHDKNAERLKKSRTGSWIASGYDVFRGWFKRHPLDCGQSGCKMCHGSKLLGAKTWRERRADEWSKGA